jgi:hypothetical protein
MGIHLHHAVPGVRPATIDAQYSHVNAVYRGSLPVPIPQMGSLRPRATSRPSNQTSYSDSNSLDAIPGYITYNSPNNSQEHFHEAQPRVERTRYIDSASAGNLPTLQTLPC